MSISLGPELQVNIMYSSFFSIYFLCHLRYMWRHGVFICVSLCAVEVTPKNVSVGSLLDTLMTYYMLEAAVKSNQQGKW